MYDALGQLIWNLEFSVVGEATPTREVECYSMLTQLEIEAFHNQVSYRNWVKTRKKEC